MRPIERGEIPFDDEGNPRQFNSYKEAKGFLIKRIGEYCSYCERFLSSDGAVEHVQPKIHYPELELEWRNFLLACRNCNSTKGHRNIDLDDYFWPDVNNTFQIFHYEEGKIKVNPTLSDELKEKAERTIKLTGLHKEPHDDPRLNPEYTDRRWAHRKEAWDIAMREKQNYEKMPAQNKKLVLPYVIEIAKRQGFWSVWVTIFRDYREVVNKLTEKFPGTFQDFESENRI